jgi:16S rRNA G966 N2-methylase RsmD
VQVCGFHFDSIRLLFSAEGVQSSSIYSCEHGLLHTIETEYCVISLQDSQLRKGSVVLDFDKQWENDPGFVFYDFNDPERIPEHLRGSFEGVLIDPPFITPEVWEKYAKTAKMLLKEGGKIICTTISGEPCPSTTRCLHPSSSEATWNEKHITSA